MISEYRARVYAMLVKHGKLTIAEVEKEYRARVEEILYPTEEE